jgi:broad specificity phosphatase PhoE
MLRHAETIDHTLFDSGLSDNGKKSCSQMSSIFKDPEIKIFTSPMLRCLETAEILQKICNRNITITVMPNLYEISYKSHPDFIPNRKDKFPKFIWPEVDKIYIEKELPHEFFLRVKNIIENLPMKSFLITHHGIIQHIINIMTNHESYRQIPLASIITVTNGKTFD